MGTAGRVCPAVSKLRADRGRQATSIRVFQEQVAMSTCRGQDNRTMGLQGKSFNVTNHV